MTGTPQDTGNNEQLLTILLAREHARADAWFRKNRRALEALLAPDFVEINTLGEFNREAILTRLLPVFTLRSFTIAEPHARWTGKDTAVISYQCKEKYSINGKDSAGNFRVVAHYSLTGKQWQLSVWQITPG